jgi:serine/threonine protein kinase
VTDATTITNPTGLMGTARYMSPEQARGQVDEIDARTDQFSLAVIAYEMLTGQNAFTGSSISSLLYQIVHEEPRALVDPVSTIPPAVASVLRRALAKNKEQRFSTVKAFAIALEEAMATGSNDAGPRPAWTFRRRLWLGAGLAALVVTGLWFLRHEPAKAIDIGSRSVPSSNPVQEMGPPPVAAPSATVPETTPQPAAVPPKRRRLKPESGRPPSVTPNPEKTDCHPTYYLDARGDKHFKPECFLNEPGVR